MGSHLIQLISLYIKNLADDDLVFPVALLLRNLLVRHLHNHFVLLWFVVGVGDFALHGYIDRPLHNVRARHFYGLPDSPVSVDNFLFHFHFHVGDSFVSCFLDHLGSFHNFPNCLIPHNISFDGDILGSDNRYLNFASDGPFDSVALSGHSCIVGWAGKLAVVVLRTGDAHSVLQE